jgi:UDP-N-acetylglucosamine--N-acetylmuramyl-(pentapeptide) pyrophosphoryl-undecaprenol N-acetylglucosamine transferase
MAHKKIIIAGGGTGGHIFPAVAIANAIKQLQPATEFLFIGAEGKMEMEKVPLEGYAIKGLTIAGFNRSNHLKNIALPFKIVKSFLQVRKIFKGFTPNAVIGVGGYSTFPVLKYAQQKGIPTFIHESNAFAGKTNKLLGKKATTVFVAAQNMDKFFPKENIIVSGNPVRKNIADNNIEKETALAFFNLTNTKPTLLIVGGSLGAKSINEAVAANLDALNKAGVQIIWQTGKPFANAAKEAVGNKPNIWVNEFIQKMEMAYAAADVVVSRAGAMAITEICLLGKPAVLVPYPHAAEDHQTHNAQQLVLANAGLMVPDNAAQEQLVNTTLTLLNNKSQQETFSTNCKKFAVPNAATLIAEKILATID